MKLKSLVIAFCLFAPGLYSFHSNAKEQPYILPPELQDFILQKLIETRGLNVQSSKDKTFLAFIVKGKNENLQGVEDIKVWQWKEGRLAQADEATLSKAKPNQTLIFHVEALTPKKAAIIVSTHYHMPGNRGNFYEKWTLKIRSDKWEIVKVELLSEV